MGFLEERQAVVDAIIRDTAVNVLPTETRLLRLAKTGSADPALLTPNEAKEVFDAFIVHYAQMGIG